MLGVRSIVSFKEITKARLCHYSKAHRPVWDPASQFDCINRYLGWWITWVSLKVYPRMLDRDRKDRPKSDGPFQQVNHGMKKEVRGGSVKPVSPFFSAGPSFSNVDTFWLGTPASSAFCYWLSTWWRSAGNPQASSADIGLPRYPTF